MNNFSPRWTVSQLVDSLDAMPVVVVTGARQTGKTTLVLNLLKDKNRRYFTMDELDILELAKTDPQVLTSQHPITLDEVQRVPEILNNIKLVTDKNRVNGAFLLTGSANLALLKTVSESLAGRALYIELPPFCPCEWTGSFRNLKPLDSLFDPDYDFNQWPNIKGDWKTWLLKGGMPPALRQKNHKFRSLWFSGYVQTYLERDLRQLSNVSSLPDFQRVMRIAANRVGRLANQSEIARDAALSQSSCHRYLNLLETGYQISPLTPYHTNSTKTLTKSKKMMFTDCGIAAWLAGIDNESLFEKRVDKGFWLEQAFFQTLQSWRSLDPVNRHLFFWRDNRAKEVDFVLEQKGKLIALEIKMNTMVSPSDFYGLKIFEKGLPHNEPLRKIVLHSGSSIRIMGNNSFALPFGWMFPK